MDLKTVVADFANQLSALIERQTVERARAAVFAAFGSPSGGKPGRPRKSAALAAVPGPVIAAPQKTRRKGPVQLCPVPGCGNPAAPIFGMVCSDHKDLPKAKIKKYREARRAAKLAGKPAPKKRGRKPGSQKAARKVAAKISRKKAVAKKAPAKKRAAKKAVTKKAVTKRPATKKAKPPVKKPPAKKRSPKPIPPTAPVPPDPTASVTTASS
jgi:hypothetical protein